MQKIFLLALFFPMSNYFAYDYPRPVAGYFSQRGQDKFLNETIFHNKTNGIFVDIGAHDGISFSNTYFFEKNLGWSGACVEPSPTIYNKLIQNRRSNCEQVCITDSVGQQPFLLCSGYILEMYSGLLKEYDQRLLDRIDQEIAIYGGRKEVILVNCLTFEALLKKYNISHIDLLSIDVEGAEEKIIKTIDFKSITIDIIVIENNFDNTVVREFLTANGFQIIKRIEKDDIYQRYPNE